MMASKILCVDDDPSVLGALQAFATIPSGLSPPFQMEAAPCAEDALPILAARGPYAVIISDMMMPGMNGAQFLRLARQIAPQSVRMMLTGCGDLQAAVEAVNDGNIFRFLTKPCSPGAFLKAVTAGIEQYRLVMAEQELLEKTLTGSIRALTDVLALASPAAFGRATRVRDLVKRLATHLKVESQWQLEVAAMLSQIGCVAVPDQVLRRIYRGADLADDERQMFADHPRVGQKLIAAIPRLENVAVAIAYQEKRFDGGGEPGGEAKGDLIPLGGRVLKVVLDFDGLCVKGLSDDQALDCMRQRSGWYDPRVVHALAAALAEATGLVLKEVSVEELMGTLAAASQAPYMLDEVKAHKLLGRMVLAENVWDSKDRLVLSKGHEITVPLLERIRNYSHRAGVIREPIKVWVPVAATSSQTGPAL